VGANQVDIPIAWAWSPREDGPILDRFVFSQVQTLTNANLDALAYG
jgi:hypothetical protein